MDADCTLVARFGRISPEEPKVSTELAVDVNCSSATLRGLVVSNGCDTCDYSFEYWVDGQQERSRTGWKPAAEREFSETITDLRPGTTYCYQALLRNSVGTGRGEIRCFQTTSLSARLTICSTAGGTVVEPGIGVFTYCERTEVPVKAEVTDLNYSFWCWQGTAVDGGKIDPNDLTVPSTTVFVDANDTLRAAFLRWITHWDDDMDRTWSRGARLSTSQLWDFVDGPWDANSMCGEGVFDVTGTAPNGRPPLPGTRMEPIAPAMGVQWWAQDPSSGRQGLVASPGGLHASIHVWPSDVKATSVWVQILWRELYIGARPLLMDLEPELQTWRMIGDMSLWRGWYHSTYAWEITPGPDQVQFTIGGAIVVDWIIVETYIEN